VYLGLYSKGSVSDAVVTDYNKKKRTFELRYVKESRGYSYNTSTGNGPDMCRKCYMAFTDGFMHYLEHANDGATKEKKE
jgi:hypothetical protein